MPHRYPAEVRFQVIELARSGTKVAQLAETFGMSDATIYNWLKQERVDRGEVPGLSTEEALDLAAAKRRIKQLETELAVSRKVNEVFLEGDLPKRLFPVIESLIGQGINVRHACRVLGVSESGYYDWKDRPAAPRTLRRIWLAGEIADVHEASAGTYGYQRVSAELRHGRDIVVGHNTVGAIMREIGLKGLPTRRLPKGARLAQVTSLDLVRREFGREGPQSAVDDRHHRAPDKGGQDLLLRRPRRLLSARRRLVGRKHPDHGLGHQRAGDGHQPPRPRRRPGDPLRPGRPIHLLGLQSQGPRRRYRPVDGSRRQRLRQCDGRVLLGANACGSGESATSTTTAGAHTSLSGVERAARSGTCRNWGE